MLRKFMSQVAPFSSGHEPLGDLAHTFYPNPCHAQRCQECAFGFLLMASASTRQTLIEVYEKSAHGGFAGYDCCSSEVCVQHSGWDHSPIIHHVPPEDITENRVEDGFFSVRFDLL